MLLENVYVFNINKTGTSDSAKAGIYDSLGLQYINNPGYNRDHRPVIVKEQSVRLRVNEVNRPRWHPAIARDLRRARQERSNIYIWRRARTLDRFGCDDERLPGVERRDA
jgi:hypothetical protein